MSPTPVAPAGCDPADLVFYVFGWLQTRGADPRLTDTTLARAERAAAQLLTDLRVPIERSRAIAPGGRS